MSSSAIPVADSALFASLNGIPKIDFPTNLQAAVGAGRRMSSILRDVVALRRATGKLTPNEYFYYRLWEPHLSGGDKRAFVGKQAQQPMHIACNNTGWYATAADKLLFHFLMTGAGVMVPTLLAVTEGARSSPGAKRLRGKAAIAAFLRDPAVYPLFAKPVDGKYSLSVVSADSYDRATDRIQLQGAEPIAPDALAKELASRDAGFLLQRRLSPHPRLAALFGPRLWSVRALVLLTPAGPVIHRAVAKIATGENPADNFWRPGNMLGALDLSIGQVSRAVRGTGAEMAVDTVHPDTGKPVIGALIPDWEKLVSLVTEAALLLPGIRTQSWDIAVTDAGPIPLEVNFGGDLNLAQLAGGAGVLDDAYREHLRRCGYRI